MPSVTIPKSFFVKERRMYSRWQFAFWREFFQNSIDAGARRIDIRLSQDAETKDITVVFTDDGCGMSREILENVYFSLGATSKNSADQVGGFGRARILTCFSMKSYRIHTLNNLVVGDGGDYEILEAEARNGTEVTVVINDEHFGDLRYWLREYMEYSDMSCDVFVDGIRTADRMTAGKFVRSLELNGEAFADVYVESKSNTKNALTVRVAGTLMFRHYISAESHVIIEIKPSCSRSVLTANRDGFQNSYNHVLSNFTQELAVETKSALKPKYNKRDRSFRGRGLNYTCGKSDAVMSGSVTSALQRVNQIFGGEGKSFGESLQHLAEKQVNTIDNVLTRNNLPDIFIVDDTFNEKVRKIIDNYNPENWKTVYNYRTGRDINKGGTIQKVLMFWQFACQEAVNALIKSNSSLSGISWGIGWIFSDEAMASCLKVDGGHALLLNPVDQEGNLKFFLSSMTSQKEMMAYAKHEVAHIIEMHHNETYAQVLTMIDAQYDERSVYRSMRTL